MWNVDKLYVFWSNKKSEILQSDSMNVLFICVQNTSSQELVLMSVSPLSPSLMQPWERAWDIREGSKNLQIFKNDSYYQNPHHHRIW